jgi:hypothetical protein
VVVATEDNAVVAMDARAGREVWKTSLRPQIESSATCGYIDPLGITGTPAIDERRGALYLDAMVNRDRVSERKRSSTFCGSPRLKHGRPGPRRDRMTRSSLTSAAVMLAAFGVYEKTTIS